MKKYFVLESVIVLACCLIGGSFIKAHAQDSARNAGVLKIGAILPLTGDFSFFGVQVKQGIDQALAEINSTEEKIKVFYEDDKCLPKEAVNSFSKLVSINHVDFIMGPACTGSIMAIAPLAERAKKYVLALLDTNKTVAELGEYIYALGYSSEDEGILVAEHLSKTNVKKVSVIYEVDAWAEIIRQAFIKRFKELGGEILNDEAQIVAGGNSAPDYRSVLTKIMRKKPAALFVVPAYNGGHFLKQFRSLGWQTPVFGPDTFAVTEVLEIAKQAAEGVVCANAIVQEDSEPAENLRNKLEKLYGQRPTSIFYSALGYDGLQILWKAAASGVGFAQAMREIKYATGVLKVDGFDVDGMSKLSAGLFQIRNQRLERLN